MHPSWQAARRVLRRQCKLVTRALRPAAAGTAQEGALAAAREEEN